MDRSINHSIDSFRKRESSIRTFGRRCRIVAWGNNGGVITANPGARRRGREIETRTKIERPGFLLVADQRWSCPLFFAPQKKEKKKSTGYIHHPLPSAASFSTYFVIPRPCDSSRSSPKCLLGWKIARVLDDGRIDLSFETKGLLMNRVAEIGRTRGVLLLDRWIKGSCDVREHMGTYVEVTRVADSGNQEEKEEKEILGEVWKFLYLLLAYQFIKNSDRFDQVVFGLPFATNLNWFLLLQKRDSTGVESLRSPGFYKLHVITFNYQVTNITSKSAKLAWKLTCKNDGHV